MFAPHMITHWAWGLGLLLRFPQANALLVMFLTQELRSKSTLTE
jgi:hypothetical protein